jgi:hypothetical protein
VCTSFNGCLTEPSPTVTRKLSVSLCVFVRLFIPIEPATKRGLSGFLAVHSSATSRAIFADYSSIHKQCLLDDNRPFR